MMANVTVGAGRVEWIKHNRLALCLMYPLNSHIKANLFPHTEPMLLQHLNILKNPIKPRSQKKWVLNSTILVQIWKAVKVMCWARWKGAWYWKSSCPGRLPCAGFEIAVTHGTYMATDVQSVDLKPACCQLSSYVQNLVTSKLSGLTVVPSPDGC